MRMLKIGRLVLRNQTENRKFSSLPNLGIHQNHKNNLLPSTEILLKEIAIPHKT